MNIAMALETENLSLNIQSIHQGVTAVMNDSSKGFYIVASNGDEIVGSLMITFEWSDWRNANFWWIQSVYVLPEMRSKGVFKSLYQYVVDLGKSNKIAGIRLYAESQNDNAHQVYKKLGMKAGKYIVFEDNLVVVKIKLNIKLESF